MFNFFKKKKSSTVNAQVSEQIVNHEVNTSSVASESEDIKEPVPAALEKKYEVQRVAGVSFRQKEIASLGFENDMYDWTKRELEDACMEDEFVYDTEFYPEETLLVPEDDNPADPKAVKVIIDDVHVGYIKKSSCAHIRKLLKNDSIEKIQAEFKGGKFKLLKYDFDEDKCELIKGEDDFSISLILTLKD